MIHNFSIIGSKSFKISFHKSEFYSEFNEKNFKIFILKIVQHRTISDFFGITSEISYWSTNQKRGFFTAHKFENEQYLPNSTAVDQYLPRLNIMIHDSF